MEFATIIVYVSIYLGLVSTTFYVLSYVADRHKKKLFYTDKELPKVSVIIPVYNEEKSIAGTIESILSSDYPKERLEVIVVDDASIDNSLKIAKKFESDVVRVLHRKINGGSKAAAFNYGYSKATGKVVISMDADTTIAKETVKNMVRYFKEEKVMAVTPAMIIRNAKGILERVQHIEYMMGLFLRKAFASLDAIYITPGAFTAYRKSFLDKYGPYEEGNVTEDLEMALRIQSKGYRIENCPEAPAYTIPMNTFKSLMIQRRRWYFGLIKNLMKYRKVVSKDYGDLGLFVIPIAVISIIFAVFVTAYLFFKTILRVKNNLFLLNMSGFNFDSLLKLNFFAIERFLFLFFTNPVVLFILFFVLLMRFYLYYAAKKVGKDYSISVNLSLFFIFFAPLFGFWWIVSIIYALFFKNIKWR